MFLLTYLLIVWQSLSTFHLTTIFTHKYHPFSLCLVDPVILRSLKYCDERVISCRALQRTALEQELGLAAYLVRVEEQRQQGLHVSSDQSESDPDKLSSTDNEEEESVMDGQLLCCISAQNKLKTLSFCLSGIQIERASIK